MTTQGAPGLLDAIFATPRMGEIFSDRARLQGMLDFEAALARALAQSGRIPGPAAEAIASRCRAELLDVGEIAAGAALAGNPAIPLVKALTALVARQDAGAAGFVHLGATSQDAMDTGLVLQMRAGLGELEADLERLSAALARLADTHRRTPMAGRTWLQQAQPITFGLKAAGWLSAVERHRARLAELRGRALSLQLGGAVGTLAGLGAPAMAVAERVAGELGLALPDLPWHAERDRVAEVAAALGLLVGTLGKIARDVSLLAQGEVGEASEPAAPGRGGSSSMPQKRNPVGSAVALAASVQVPALVSVMLSAMVQEHERGLGSWQAEWETLPRIFLLAAGALRQTVEVLSGLAVDEGRMRRNLESPPGGAFAGIAALALAAHLGKPDADALVERSHRRALEQGRHLREVLAEEPAVKGHLAPDELARLFDPASAVGAAEELVDRVLAARARGS
jgi:3-carboxy-cis,cis-muconate cycloisomerase